ncbi:ABC transporter permease [Variovorax atrisoli]|uniref:ABC transporter permease n=1 Tax=Variovorax atrisoli TaxID=3394203 RepID=UPI0009B723E7|nr:ABC transporter permease subunit [Variovorax paradoxus]
MTADCRLWPSRMAGLAIFLACWQVAGLVVGDYWMPGPAQVAQRLWAELTAGSLLRDLWATGRLVLVGTLGGTVLGIGLACLLRLLPRLDSMLQPFITALMSLPKLGLVPLLVLWFGTGLAPQLLLVVLTVLFIVFAIAYAGLITVNRQLLMTARVFGASALQLTRFIVLPTLWPFVLTGLEVALPWALSAALVAEFLSAKVGVGHAIDQARQVRDSVGVFYGIAAATAIVLVCNAALALARRLTLKIQPEH